MPVSDTHLIIGGFAHAQVFALADKIVEAVKSGAIRKFVVMISPVSISLGGWQVLASAITSEKSLWPDVYKRQHIY